MKDTRKKIETLLNMATEQELERIYKLTKAVLLKKAGVENDENIHQHGK